MSPPFFLLWLVIIIPLAFSANPPLKGYYLSCGSNDDFVQNGLSYTPDESFIEIGNKSAVKGADLWPVLTTLRYFPDKSARKFCYDFEVVKGVRYVVRTIYYYGDFDGGKVPPVFDQIVQGTKWSVVNTTEDFAKGMSSFFEIIVGSTSNTLSVCLARNKYTSSYPFISALEVQTLDESAYNSTDFSKYALSTVDRSHFGTKGSMISFPDDQYNRRWQVFSGHEHPVTESKSNVTSSDFWNSPPQKVFAEGITTSRGKTLKLQWPAVSLPSTKYYIALYFHDNRTPSPYSWRVFSISINGKNFYKDLNVTTDGVMVYASEWPLSGQTEISLIPEDNVPVGPLINAAEIFQILPLGGRTNAVDVMVMKDLAKSFDNPPPDWKGDPCLPTENSWTGVSCSKDALARVTSLNISGMGIKGSLPSSIGNLTALTQLNLENNHLNGSIPESLGSITNLHQVKLQGNNFSGQVPKSLQNKNGVNVKVSSGKQSS